MLHKKQKRENTDKERESRAREDDVVDVVLHLLPRPALLSLAVQWGVAIEIERAIKKSASFC